MHGSDRWRITVASAGTTLLVASTLVAIMFIVTSCTGMSQARFNHTQLNQAHMSTDPLPSNDELRAVDVTGIAVPEAFTSRRIVDPQWVVGAQQMDGVFVAPRETESRLLEFLAVNTHGDIVWSAMRPITCTGFHLTRTDSGRAVAVLTDVTLSEDAIAVTTASAYDLATGEPVWGPVDVPGPLLGPGLIFAATPAATLGVTGAKIALAPDTGAVIADEADGEQQEANGTLLAEFNGDVLWSHDLPGLDGGKLQNRGHSLPVDTPFVVIESDEDRVVVDVHTGAVVAEQVQGAWLDTSTNVLVTTDGSTLSGLLGDQIIWSTPHDASLIVEGAASGELYLRDDGQPVVMDTVTGDRLPVEFSQPHNSDARRFVPRFGSVSGATVVQHHSTQYLVTE